MVGNDVVDLHDPETSPEGLNPRFDERVFTTGERHKLASASDAHSLRWTMWAAKESAYKLAKRFDCTTIFAHSQFETKLDENGSGQVHHNCSCYAINVICVESAIHAIAMTDHRHREHIVFGLNNLPDGGDPSESVRELARTAIADQLDIDATLITITTGAHRIPVLRVDGMPNGHLSLSHHGAHIAFAWMPPL